MAPAEDLPYERALTSAPGRSGRRHVALVRPSGAAQSGTSQRSYSCCQCTWRKYGCRLMSSMPPAPSRSAGSPHLRDQRARLQRHAVGQLDDGVAPQVRLRRPQRLRPAQTTWLVPSAGTEGVQTI
ncbi:jg7831 [Pararge aegeria aegeria]|uniref:Jg7831 protein n=1 Tax=Pararge aegeria aegeria TaxID=348720 RepID=A0A8S4RN08_9NEOP|nr:jg7831 [Pararge aegeria aegeria]